MLGIFRKKQDQLFSIILLLLFIHVSCNSEEKQKTKAAVPVATTIENQIKITKKQFDSGKMELGQITKQSFITSVKANGILAVLPQNRAEISPYFGGYVKSITLLPGDVVKKGEVLFTLENPAFVEIQQGFLEARGRLSYLQADYERQKELVADNVSSQKKFLKAEADYKVAQAQYQSLKKKLILMNINPGTLNAENMRTVIGVRSPISGFATKITAHKGSYLKPDTIAVTITNTDHLHVELKVFEKDLPNIRVGQEVKVKLQRNPHQTYHAKVSLINKAIDFTERTIEIHADFLNEEEKSFLIPGMYVEGEILTTSQQNDALPVEAVSIIDSDYFVLLKENDSIFTMKEVQVGMNNGIYIQILNVLDFESQSMFLTRGAFNLITE